MASLVIQGVSGDIGGLREVSGGLRRVSKARRFQNACGEFM